MNQIEMAVRVAALRWFGYAELDAHLLGVGRHPTLNEEIHRRGEYLAGGEHLYNVAGKMAKRANTRRKMAKLYKKMYRFDSAWIDIIPAINKALR